MSAHGLFSQSLLMAPASGHQRETQLTLSHCLHMKTLQQIDRFLVVASKRIFFCPSAIDFVCVAVEGGHT